MAEKLTIQFKAVGAGALKKTIEDLHLANIQLTKGQAAFVRAQKRVQQTLKKGSKEWVHYHRNVGKAGGITSKFGIAMSSVRSKLLIYAFAVGLVSTAMKKLFDRFIEQEKVEKKLEVALGGVNTELLNQASALQQVTTFGDESIIGVQALIAAFTDDEEAIKSATKATLDLAAAKGMDLNAAADLVSKTLGSSTNSLSRYGVVVEGAVGSTARLDSLTENIADLFGGQATAATETLGGSIQQMSNAFGDASEAIGEGFAPIMRNLAPILRDAAFAAREMLLGFQETELETAIRHVEEMGGNVDDLKLKMLEAQKVDLSAKMNKVNHILELSVAQLAEMGVLESDFKESKEKELILQQDIAAEALKVGNIEEKREAASMSMFAIRAKAQSMINAGHKLGFEQTVEQLKYEQLLAIKDLEKLDNLKAQLEAQKKTTAENKANLDTSLEYEVLLAKIAALQNKIAGTTKKTSQTFNEWLIKNKESIDSIMDTANQMSDIFGELASRAREEAQETIDALNEIADAQIDLIKENAKNTIAEEKKTRRWQRMTAKQQAAYEKKIMDDVAKNEAEINAQREKDAEKAKEKANKLLLIQFRIDQALSIAKAVMNTSEAYTKALAVPPAPNIFLAGLTAALGAVQIGLIASQTPPKMARGGYIGGRSHAEGGTMIEAERGEFVMSRGAVDALGVETMNRINQGGGANSINISFSGNILSRDFIIDEAIPEIRNAIRRGEDIGIG